MRPIYITKSLATAADADGIAQDQAIAGGELTLNGALVDADGVAQLGSQRRVLLTPGAGDNLTGIVFTITGTDDEGHEISEDLDGPNAVTAQSVLDYATVTSISADVAGGAGETVSFGTNGVGATPPVPMDKNLPNFNAMIACIIRSGAANYTVQYTFDDIWLAYAPYNTLYPGQPAGDPSEITWWDHADITASATNDKGSLVNPVTAVRLLINSGVGEVEMQVIQQGTF